MTGTNLVNVDAVLDLLHNKAEELRTTATTEERKAAGDTTKVYRLRFAADTIDGLAAEIGTTAPVPGLADAEVAFFTPEEDGVPEESVGTSDTTPPAEEN